MKRYFPRHLYWSIFLWSGLVLFNATGTETENQSFTIPDMIGRPASPPLRQRDEQVQKADEAALRGQRLFADGDYIGANSKFREALQLLPNRAASQPRRDEYTAYFHESNVFAVRTDWSEWHTLSVLRRLRESGTYLALELPRLRNQPVKTLRALAFPTWVPLSFILFFLLGILGGLIQFQSDKPIRLPFYLFPFALPLATWLMIVIAILAGYIERAAPMLEILSGLILIFLVACSVTSVPYLMGKIASFRWRLHRLRQGNERHLSAPCPS